MVNSLFAGRICDIRVALRHCCINLESPIVCDSNYHGNSAIDRIIGYCRTVCCVAFYYMDDVVAEPDSGVKRIRDDVGLGNEVVGIKGL